MLVDFGVSSYFLPWKGEGRSRSASPDESQSQSQLNIRGQSQMSLSAHSQTNINQANVHDYSYSQIQLYDPAGSVDMGLAKGPEADDSPEAEAEARFKRLLAGRNVRSTQAFQPPESFKGHDE